MLWHVLIYRAGDSHLSCALTIAIPAPVKTAPSVLGCDRFLLAGEATNQKKSHGCVKIDTPWPFSILILRDARAPKRRAILKPFCDAIWGPGQASTPRQSRESQPFVRLPPLYSPFSSIVTPYNGSFAVLPGYLTERPGRKMSHGHKKSPHGDFRKGLFFMEPAKRLELLAC